MSLDPQQFDIKRRQLQEYYDLPITTLLRSLGNRWGNEDPKPEKTSKENSRRYMVCRKGVLTWTLGLWFGSHKNQSNICVSDGDEQGVFFGTDVKGYFAKAHLSIESLLYQRLVKDSDIPFSLIHDVDHEHFYFKFIFHDYYNNILTNTIVDDMYKIGVMQILTPHFRDIHERIRSLTFM